MVSPGVCCFWTSTSWFKVLGKSCSMVHRATSRRTTIQRQGPPKKIPKVVPIHWGLYLFNMFLTFKVSNVSCGYCYLNLCSSKSGSTKGSPGGILSAHWSASLKQWLSDNCLEIVDPHWSTGYCGLVHAILFTRLTWVCPLLWMEEILHHLGWLKPYK